ncbi:DoxX family protein [candidate division KSB1 bacterium]|nr:MAG: DoxX family protein [candidate division KSB1 bacterium]
MKTKLADFGLLFLRVAVGLGLIIHGWLKLSAGVNVFADNLIEPIGFPYPLLFAWLSVAAEILGGFFFILGLWTRWAAIPVIVNMAIAAFNPLAPAAFIAPGKPSKELALAYLVTAITVLLLGPGPYAVDGGRKSGGRSTAKKSKR